VSIFFRPHMADAALDALCSAAFTSDLGAVKAALQTSPELRDRLSRERETTVLYTACRFGHLDLVTYLVEDAGCDVNLPNGPRGAASTPLHGAAFGGHTAVVQYLAEHGAVLKQNDYGDTPLEDLDNSETVKDADKKKCRAILLKVRDGKMALSPKKKKKDRKDEAGVVQGAAPSAAADPPVPITLPGPADSPPAAAVASSSPPCSPTAPGDSLKLSLLTVARLKARCKELGIADVGTKATLIRNIEAIAAGHSPPPLDVGAPSLKKPRTEGSDSGDDLLQPLSKATIAELKTATFTLTEIEKDSEAFWDMEDKFKANIQGRIEDYVQTRITAGKRPLTFILVKCERVVNAVLARRFERRKAALVKEAPEHSRERVSFHCTDPKHVSSICKTSLLRYKHPLNPCKTQSDDGYFGTNRKGVYVSRYSDYTYKYCNDALSPLDAGQTAQVIMFRTLPGKTFHIKNLVGGIDPTPGYHSHSSPNFMEWYLFNEDQRCPDYVLTIKAVEDSRTVADDEEAP
jgi:hypothetical protein